MRVSSKSRNLTLRLDFHHDMLWQPHQQEGWHENSVVGLPSRGSGEWGRMATISERAVYVRAGTPVLQSNLVKFVCVEPDKDFIVMIKMIR